ncbi:hypothetical protein ABZW18_21950 [Streptomyces sp. NPDC004647]|uniref:hypothetical protein n=1 Tax=Streptomyces sp. NPDC004647 TaxID=3154671 RepID=UPI0033AD89C8
MAVAVLGAVLGSRFGALLPAALAGTGSLPAASAAARTDADRTAVADAFASGVGAAQLVGVVAVFLGGWVAALLLRRAAS